MSLQERALDYAIKHHGKQMYGDKPYHHHLSEVASYVNNYTFVGYINQNTAIAFLHDIIEDTDIEYSDIASEFGETIADAIDALSHTNGDFYSYLAKIKSNRSATIVKMCDRLANVTNIPRKKTAIKYINQYIAFKAALYIPSDINLWNRLDKAHRKLESFYL